LVIRTGTSSLSCAPGCPALSRVHVPAPDGTPDGYVRIRLDQTGADTLRGYNRPEHLRVFPEDDPVFVDVQRHLRASAESSNWVIDDHHPRERLHNFGFDRKGPGRRTATARPKQCSPPTFGTNPAFSPGPADPPTPSREASVRLRRGRDGPRDAQPPPEATSSDSYGPSTLRLDRVLAGFHPRFQPIPGL
jgi:hypothetical protein